MSQGGFAFQGALFLKGNMMAPSDGRRTLADLPPAK